ncbi:branched-chain amino acid transport system ATP-binding protein [Propionibacterium cyclohexanicum]|uniref:Branched-chain amino acid transport system ATP-binding protein n=2 Tax=Propionibacterium cyclohexanicum TaxID=64702 RepID=A0A1H9T4G2_9ACTN|nr:branched-chain amino acid transport system ATP-binding protein [Propionibacterium cyclohexanicum]
MSTATTTRDLSAIEHGQMLLDARQVTMRFGGLVAVNKVDLQVHSGEIVGLIGPNGAGKTTFFNCLTGMYRPTSGEVVFAGKLLPPRPAKVARAGVARTFQNIRLFQNMTTLENVLVGMYCRTHANALDAVFRTPRHHREEADCRARAMELLGFVGLADHVDDLARSLPYGHQRRLEIARALATEPKLLLLDEPTAGMNPQETKEAEELIFRIRDLGLAVLVIEHDMRFIFSLCDRVTCLVRGEVLVTGTGAQVQADERVVEAYIGAPFEPEAPAGTQTREDDHGTDA